VHQSGQAAPCVCHRTAARCGGEPRGQGRDGRCSKPMIGDAIEGAFRRCGRCRRQSRTATTGTYLGASASVALSRKSRSQRRARQLAVASSRNAEIRHVTQVVAMPAIAARYDLAMPAAALRRAADAAGNGEGGGKELRPNHTITILSACVVTRTPSNIVRDRAAVAPGAGRPAAAAAGGR